MKAFAGLSERRDALLRRIEEAEPEQGSIALTNRDATSDEVATFADEFGLHPAFIFLVSNTEPGVPDQVSWSALRSFVRAVEPGADWSRVFSGWMEWAWVDAEAGLRALLRDPALKAEGDRVAELHRRVLANDEPSRQEWRAARVGVALSPEDEPVAYMVMDAIRAGSWDFAAMPGSAADAIGAYLAAQLVVRKLALGWNEEDQQLTGQVAGAILTAVEQNPVEGETPYERKLRFRRYLKMYFDQNKDGLGHKGFSERFWSLQLENPHFTAAREGLRYQLHRFSDH